MEVAQPGQGIGRDIARGEAVEHELDQFITKRQGGRVLSERERLEEESWKASERREEDRGRTEEGHSRLLLCRHLEAVYARRSEEWRRQGDELEGIGGTA